MNNIHLHNADNLEIMKTLPDESIDVICIDPPYLYLKNQKLERVFDELKFFSECKRLLTKDGFIVMFGRGTSFYRWNTILEDLKFTFKEEIVWDKQQISIPAAPILRVHEMIVIYAKNSSKLNPSTVPYLEVKKYDIDSLVSDIKRIKSAVNSKEIHDIQKYIETGETIYSERNGKTFFKNAFGDRSRGLVTIKSILNGIREKTIIRQTRDHYSAIHPTQKPVRLLERLLKLVIPMKKKKIVVADWFSGSNSCCEAVINLQSEFPDIEFEFIGTEIDKEYFEAGKERIENVKNKMGLFSLQHN